HRRLRVATGSWEDAAVSGPDHPEDGSEVGGASHQPSSEPAREERSGRRTLDRLGLKRAREGAEWGRRKYAGSSAQYLWDRLNAIDLITLAILFAATVLLCFVPFLIVGNALAGRSTVHTLARHAGLNEEAAADFNHLIAPSATTFHAVAGTASVVFF